MNLQLNNYTTLLILNFVHILSLLAIFVRIGQIAKTIKVMSREEYQIWQAYREFDNNLIEDDERYYRKYSNELLLSAIEIYNNKKDDKNDNI